MKKLTYEELQKKVYAVDLSHSEMCTLLTTLLRFINDPDVKRIAMNDTALFNSYTQHYVKTKKLYERLDRIHDERSNHDS